MAKLVVSDLDDTLVIGTDGVNEALAARLRRKASEGYEVVIVSGRSDSRLDETRQWLDDNEIPHFQIHLSDFPAGPNASREFKLYKAQLLLDAGHTIEEWWENDADTRAGLAELGIDVQNPAELTSGSSSAGNTTSSGTGKAMQVKRISSSATFEIKAATDTTPAGEVVAVVSVFNNTDLVGERVMPGAFTKSLEQYASTGRSIPFVWSHQWDNPDYYIGAVREATETDEGLVVRAELFDTPTANHLKTLLQEGVISQFSFAYDVLQESKGSDGVRQLDELRIHEVGPTLVGANNATRLIGVRAASLDEPTSLGTDAKAGRTLSSKNESRIKDAVQLLSDVLGSLPVESDTSKSEEPMVKDEAKVETLEATPMIDAVTAHLLLEIETEIE